jgi:hypothetical protein
MSIYKNFEKQDAQNKKRNDCNLEELEGDGEVMIL